MVRIPLPEIWTRALDLPKLCDGCNAAFSSYHVLDCKKGGLITVHHNELRDRVANLSGKAFTPAKVYKDPLIFVGQSVQRPKDHASGTTP